MPLSELPVPADSGPGLLRAAPNPLPVDSSATTISLDHRRRVDWSGVWVSQDGGHDVLFGEGESGLQRGRLDYPRRDLRVPTLRRYRTGQAGRYRHGRPPGRSRCRSRELRQPSSSDPRQPDVRVRFEVCRSTATTSSDSWQRDTADIRGRVLEIGEATYTRRFSGGRVAAIDVLHVTAGNPEADARRRPVEGGITSRLRHWHRAFLLMQTLHRIFNVSTAIRTVHRMLKPGGVVLATFPGISQRSADQWSDSWYWGFTSLSARRLFGDVFPADGLTVETQGTCSRRQRSSTVLPLPSFRSKSSTTPTTATKCSSGFER